MVAVSADGFKFSNYEFAEEFPKRGAICGYCANRWRREQGKVKVATAQADNINWVADVALDELHG
jgi:hypothetical protein